MKSTTIRTRQRLGKYRIEGKLGDGAFATVYQAKDTLEGVRVALKIPHAQFTDDLLDEFRNEVRLAATLKHPNILPLKNADIIAGRLVLAYPLGERSLADRLQSRMSLTTALDLADQLLAAATHAHEHRVIHCDIKPENMILFPCGTLMLTDFGIAKVAQRTIQASGSGTIGYCAPEQAMGKPSFRSDVFSLGLVLYRMLSGQLPEWPFSWPPPGHDRLRGRIHSDVIEVVRRAIAIDPRKRFSHAGSMHQAFRLAKRRGLHHGNNGATINSRNSRTPTQRDWKTVRHRQFQRLFGKQLETHCACSRCHGPVSEYMTTCPWCSAGRSKHDETTRFPLQCPRCCRGLKQDWSYCPWCFGSGFEVTTSRAYSDARYAARCFNAQCSRKQLMPFMRYCPWCRRKVKRKWTIEGTRDKCPSCEWGVVLEFWNYCPWCSRALTKK